MDENRLQAYEELIKFLLDSPIGEEDQVLQANSELVDAGLVQMMALVAEHLATEGSQNAAWLSNYAVKIAYSLGIVAATPEEYKQFVLEVLLAIVDSDDNPQVIYPLLQANLDKLDDGLTQILQVWATQTLAEVEPAEAQSIAYYLVTFGNLVGQFTLGNRASNLETAIASYKNTLQIYTREAFPEQWAAIQNNLATAYTNRIRGEKAENLENSIASCHNALEIRTREAFPVDWAMTQHNLATAYLCRILGEKADNLEAAIASYKNALQIYTREAFPVDWAGTQNNLALAYTDRILGEKADNLEAAIASYKNALQIYTREAFPVDWAGTQNNLANAYLYRILGEKADNLEDAIASYKNALQIRTCEAFPFDWATTQNNLALAYTDRILGEKADNLEAAIAFYKNALEIYTREAFPEQWAMTQNNLALAYTDRIREEKAENLESAIASCNNALEIYTREAFPEQWAQTQNNLALVYTDRIREEKAENLESAIASCNNALEVYTRKAFPFEWARTQNNLASAYLYRILGEKAENLEAAIAFYKNALEVYTRKAFPFEWARTQNNLASAYLYRILGEKAENLEAAIASYKNALQIYTSEAFPVDWARTQNNLASAYLYRILGEKAENLESAIASLKNALEVYTRKAFPVEWARTQNNLALVYTDRIRGKKADNLEAAIASCNNALEIYTREAFPVDWAWTQNNLASAYLYRILGEKADNLESAIASLKNALQIRTREAFPQSHSDSLFNLGLAYREAQQWQDAYDTFVATIQTTEFLREEILSGDESKQKLAEEWNRLYRYMLETCLQLNQPTKALEYAERSKTRNLVEAIFLRDSHSIFPLEDAEELAQLRDEIAKAQYQIQQGQAANYRELAQSLQDLRQQRNQLQDSYLPIGSSFQFDLFQQTLDRETAVIEWYISNDTFLAFIITKDAPLSFWQSTSADLQALRDFTFSTYLPSYDNEPETWRNRLTEALQNLSQILHLKEILQLLPSSCNRLILIPHRFLHLLPLHSLPMTKDSTANTDTSPTYLLDCFSGGISYAPSCQLLQQLQTRQRNKFSNLFAIQTPTDDLYGKDKGAVSAIEKQFTHSHILRNEEATKSALFEEMRDLEMQGRDIPNTNLSTQQPKLPNAHCLFFFCHGYFKPESPLDSGLKLADGKLTVREIIANFRLNNCRLVNLSACETGIPDSGNSDEYISLPYGFLLAGSTNVVSSLWTVDATATALLMTKFYEELQQQDHITLAMRTAQSWLRDSTIEDFQAWLSQSKLSRFWKSKLRKQFDQQKQDFGATTKPFNSAYYWSAFCVIGKGE
ncbi:MAG: tetratricopeptide repeat protein [Symploca sp. SIO3E6]|nr:tetratricopeptide repeat protein [Caldora sp. SIO3E6]